jgi:diguanylate cyclase (GGDEF)-like protein/PAS domain S-box-containing protein
MADRKKPISHYFSAAIITAIYAVAAIAWIFLSDYLLVVRIDEPVSVVEYQSLKDWGFILVTTLILYAAILFHLRKYSHHLHKFKSQRGEMRMLSQFRKSVIDNASVWINVLDQQGYITVWNKAAEEISGYRREEVLKNVNVWQWLYPDPDYRASVVRISQEIISRGAEVNGFETTIHTKSGEEKIIAWHSRRFLNDKDKVMGSIAIGRDITEQKRAVQALKERENQLARLMDNLPGMAYRRLNDDYWTMKFVSTGCRKLTGYESEALTDNRDIDYDSIIHEADRSMVRKQVKRALNLKRPFAMEYRIRRRDGSVIWVWEQGQAAKVGSERFLEGVILDINQRKLMEQELERLATHDPLTGLYNRRELEQQLYEEIARAKRYKHPLSLLWLDVDHFKSVNDNYGHLAGDEVLRRLSQLLQSSVRSVDYVARYGGEELVIVLPEVGAHEALEMAERLCQTVENYKIPIADDKQLKVTVSIGVAAYPVHGHEVSQLFSKADEAMYLAKQQGRNRVVGAVEEESSSGRSG